MTNISIDQFIPRRLDAIPESHADDNANVDAAVLTYVLILMFCSVGVFVLDYIFHSCQRIKVPNGLWYFLFGLIVAGIALGLGLQKNHSEYDLHKIEGNFIYGLYEYVIGFPKMAYYKILLPILLMGAAYNTDTLAMKEVLYGSMLRAIVGCVLSSFVLSGIIYGVWDLWWPHMEIEWDLCMLMAVVLASFDPISGVSILERLGAPHRMLMLFEGEAHIIDGITITLVQVVGLAVFGHNGHDAKGSYLVGKIFFIFFLSPLMGIAYGLAVVVITFLFKRKPYVCAFWLISQAVLSFYLAEVAGLAGGMVVVIMGLFVSEFKRRLWRASDEKVVNATVNSLSKLAEVFIFVLSGCQAFFVVIAPYLDKIATKDTAAEDYFKQYYTDFYKGLSETETEVSEGEPLGVSACIWLGLMIARGVSVFALVPIENLWTEEKITWREQMMMWIGNVKGAVPIVLALQPSHHFGFLGLHSSILVIVVCISMLVQGLTIGLVYTWVEPYPAGEDERLRIEELQDKDAEFLSEIDRDITDDRCAVNLNLIFPETDDKTQLNNVVPALGANVFVKRRTPCLSLAANIAKESPLSIGMRSIFNVYHKKLSRKGICSLTMIEINERHMAPRFDGLRYGKNSLIVGKKRMDANTCVDVWMHKMTREEPHIDNHIPHESGFSSAATILEKYLEQTKHDADKDDKIRFLNLAYITEAALHSVSSYFDEGQLDVMAYRKLYHSSEVAMAYIDACKVYKDAWHLFEHSLTTKQNGKMPWWLKAHQKMPCRLTRAWAYATCYADLSAVAGFLDIYENLILVLAVELEDKLCGDRVFCEMFATAIRKAEEYVEFLMDVYGEIFDVAIFVCAARFSCLQKIEFVNDRRRAGLLDEKTCQFMVKHLTMDLVRLSKYWDFSRSWVPKGLPDDRTSHDAEVHHNALLLKGGLEEIVVETLDDIVEALETSSDDTAISYYSSSSNHK